jgi:hypothetical protein
VLGDTARHPQPYCHQLDTLAVVSANDRSVDWPYGAAMRRGRIPERSTADRPFGLYAISRNQATVATMRSTARRLVGVRCVLLIVLFAVAAVAAAPASASSPGWRGEVTVLAETHYHDEDNPNHYTELKETTTWTFTGTASSRQIQGDWTRWQQKALWEATYARSASSGVCPENELNWVYPFPEVGSSPSAGFFLERQKLPDGTMTFRLVGNPMAGWNSTHVDFPTHLNLLCPPDPVIPSTEAKQACVFEIGYLQPVTVPASRLRAGGSYTLNPNAGLCNSSFETVTVDWTLNGEPQALFDPEWLGGNAESLDGTRSKPSALGTKIVKWEWSFDEGGTAAGSVVTKSFSSPGTHFVTLKVTDDKGQTNSLTKRITVNPTATYAPYVRFHDQEKYFPADPRAFINNSSLYWERGRIGGNVSNGLPFALTCPPFLYASTVIPSRLGDGDYRYQDTLDPQVIGVGTPDETVCATLDTTRWFSSTDLTYPVNNDKDPSDNRRSQGFYLDLRPAGEGANATVAKGIHSAIGPQTGPGTYYEYQPGRYAVYWFWYPMNYWTSPGTDVSTEIHEGDWEHIVVRLDGGDNASAVAYYYHYCGPDKHGWGSMLIPPLRAGGLYEGTHPIVFSARGGHASYWNSGNVPLVDGVHAHEKCSGSTQYYDETATQVTSTDEKYNWKTWVGMQDARTQPWYGFGGAWGWGRGDMFPPTLVPWGPPGPSPKRAGVPSGW